VFECVINISEGRNTSLLRELGVTAGPSLRDLHADEFHHRSVFTLVNEPDQLQHDVRALLGAAYTSLDLTLHEGVHPRFGVVDVVPFVALETEDPGDAVALRDATAQWISGFFDVPVFLYGPLGGGVRTLPEVRRGAFRTLQPDCGPPTATTTRGATAVGARPLLVAWNLWLRGVSMEQARAIARALRRPDVRALAFQVGDLVQVSCNLINPLVAGPSDVFDQVTLLLRPPGEIVRSELVGLVPAALLEKEEPARWRELDLDDDRTIEGRLAR
jgi:glutamate formiminotransferase